MKKAINLFVLIISMMFFVSCESERQDGDWDPMEWKSTVSISKNKEVTIPAEGGVFTFTCKNYNYLWYVGGKTGDKYFEYDPGQKEITQDWLYCKIEDNVATFTFQPNDSEDAREQEFYFSVGDAFSNFKFIQKSKDK